ncbi:Sec14p-like phosphatidylinositol transfer family protein [Zea mays]|uniref:Sec14p-like phosphatidylinositol transfer family protein n=1 Tax=Zea mays TaxID=4577 RepID=A0A1D6IZ07_MAIZE|nr:Sec14p-like phosphatidylinositol transfer family protein [Zea mays]
MKPKPLTRGTRLSHRLSHALIPSTPPPPDPRRRTASTLPRRWG